MTDEKKRGRVLASQKAAAAVVGKRAISLTIGLLRAKIARDGTRQILSRLADASVQEEQLRSEAADEALKLEATDFSRADSLYSLYLGLLYAVVEKWREWGFADPDVDRLAADGRITSLRKYRNVIFHCGHYDHKDMTGAAEQAGMLEWADDLYMALETFFKKWHAAPEAAVVAHLKRTGGQAK